MRVVCAILLRVGSQADIGYAGRQLLQLLLLAAVRLLRGDLEAQRTRIELPPAQDPHL